MYSVTKKDVNQESFLNTCFTNGQSVRIKSFALSGTVAARHHLTNWRCRSHGRDRVCMICIIVVSTKRRIRMTIPGSKQHLQEAYRQALPTNRYSQPSPKKIATTSIMLSEHVSFDGLNSRHDHQPCYNICDQLPGYHESVAHLYASLYWPPTTRIVHSCPS